MLALKPAPGDPAIDCRVFERQVCELPTVCHPASLQEMAEHRWQGVITDISRGGICLRLVRRFEKGAALAVEIPGDGVREPYVVFVKVMNVTRDEDRWILGCKFVSEMGDDEMQRLLTATQYVLSAPKESAPKDAE